MRIVGPDVVRVGVRPNGPDQRLPGGGELLARPSLAGGGQQGLGILAPLVRGADEDGKDGQPFTRPGVHPRLAAPHEFAPGQILVADGAGSHPRAPPAGIFERPFGHVQIEGADAGQRVVVAESLHHGLDLLAGAGRGRLASRLEPLFPGAGDLARQA